MAGDETPMTEAPAQKVGPHASRRVAAAPAGAGARPAKPVISRVVPRGTAAALGQVRESGPIEFLLFLLLNAVVIIRPADFVAAVQGLPIYQGVIILCCLASARSLLQLLRLQTWVDQPVTVCVFGVWAAVVLSQLAHGHLRPAWEWATEFGKIVVYYCLLIAAVNSPRRLRQFLTALVVFVTVVALVAVLQYRGIINIAALDPFIQGGGFNDEGERIVFVRLRGVGLFNDPNDLSLILVMAMMITLRGVIDAPRGLRKIGWVGLLAFLGYALSLTQSRGGFLGLLAGSFVLFGGRFGWRRALAAGVVVVPVLLFLFGGRQTDISTDVSTGQGRLQLWWLGFDKFLQAPLFGIGAGKFAEDTGLVTHNSFVQSFTELGILGGALFLGCFHGGLTALARLRPAGAAQAGQAMEGPARDDERLRAYLVAVLAAYGVGLLSLSRVYVVPTYLVLGTVAAYLHIAGARTGRPALRFDSRYMTRLAGLSVVAMVAWFAVTRVFVRW